MRLDSRTEEHLLSIRMHNALHLQICWQGDVALTMSLLLQGPHAIHLERGSGFKFKQLCLLQTLKSGTDFLSFLLFGCPEPRATHGTLHTEYLKDEVVPNAINGRQPLQGNVVAAAICFQGIVHVWGPMHWLCAIHLKRSRWQKEQGAVIRTCTTSFSFFLS